MGWLFPKIGKIRNVPNHQIENESNTTRNRAILLKKLALCLVVQLQSMVHTMLYFERTKTINLRSEFVSALRISFLQSLHSTSCRDLCTEIEVSKSTWDLLGIWNSAQVKPSFSGTRTGDFPMPCHMQLWSAKDYERSSWSLDEAGILRGLACCTSPQKKNEYLGSDK